MAQKHDWPESLVWSQALVNADDFDRFKALHWGIRAWDVWNFMDCDSRFGDDWPGHKNGKFQQGAGGRAGEGGPGSTSIHTPN